MLEEAAWAKCVVCIKSRRLICLDKDLEFSVSTPGKVTLICGNICMTNHCCPCGGPRKPEALIYKEHYTWNSVSKNTLMRANQLFTYQFYVILLCQPLR